MAKFSFENTIGELLAEPKVVELINEIFPDLLKNPMIEMAKSLKLNYALPYIESEVPREKIEEFRIKLSQIE